MSDTNDIVPSGNQQPEVVYTEKERQWLTTYRPARHATIQSITKGSWNSGYAVVVKTDDGEEFEEQVDYQARDYAVGGDAILYWRAGTKEGEYYDVWYSRESYPYSESKLIEWENSRRKDFLDAMKWRERELARLDDFSKRYAAFFGNGRVRRVKILSEHKSTGNFKVIDDQGRKFTAKLDAYSLRVGRRHWSSKVGDHGLAIDTSKDAVANWEWNTVKNPQEPATDEEYQNAHETQYAIDLKAETELHRPLYEVAARDNTALAPLFDPKVVYEHSYYRDEKGEIKDRYIPWEVVGITPRSVLLDAGWGFCGGGYFRSGKDIKIRLDRRTLERGASVRYGTGTGRQRIDISFVLHPPGEEQTSVLVPESGRIALLAILGLTAEQDSEKDIVSAYRVIVREHHPDISDSAESVEALQKASNAYELLMKKYRTVRDVQQAESTE